MELTKLASYGVVGLAIAALSVTLLIVKLFIDYMQNANKVVQANTKAINQLTNTLVKSDIMEENFRKELMEVSRGTNEQVKDVKGLVKNIHERVVV